MRVLLLIVGIICASIPANATKCYICSHTNAAQNEDCVSNLEGVTVRDCDEKYCLSIREERVETKDLLSSIYRTCADAYIFKNKVIVDAFYRTHYIACTTDLCNGGNGRVADTNRDPDDGDEIVLIVPGTQNGNIVKVSYYLICLILVNIFRYGITVFI